MEVVTETVVTSVVVAIKAEASEVEIAGMEARAMIKMEVAMDAEEALVTEVVAVFKEQK